MTIFFLWYLFKHFFSVFPPYSTDGMLMDGLGGEEREYKLQDNPTLKRQHQMATLGDSNRAMPKQKTHWGSLFS